MWEKIIGIIVTAFLLGWTTHTLLEPMQEVSVEEPRVLAPERPSPSDWISQEEIQLSQDGVYVEIADPQWATFTDTNSMDPLLDETVHAIQRVPQDPAEIHVGDVISYRSGEHVIIHRVVEVGNDGAWYALTKGDNNPLPDPEKVRFEDVERVLVAVIY